MSRAGLLIGAVLLVVVAVGLLLWTDLLKTFGVSTPLSSPDDKFLTQMHEAAQNGGHAVSFVQSDAGRWRVGQGHRLERFSIEGGEVFARLTSQVPLNATTWEWSTQGLSVTFPVGFNNETNGQNIEIGVVARAPAANGSKEISVVYATQQAGNSGWRTIPLTGEFALNKFTFAVPRVEPGAYTKQPILVINADKSGSGHGAEILGVYVRRL
jgi:hypothetical protein